MTRFLCACTLTALLLPAAFAKEQTDRAPDELRWAPPKKDWEWDEDERFDELMKQLAINEARLEAIDDALATQSRKKAKQSATAKRMDENNRMMDRKGGGPMKWDEFYGTNAEKFFYHPVDPNTTYRTDTFLRQMGKSEDDKSGEDTPSRQSLPVHQRPPQWDYIYRANTTAREKALADASIAESEIEQLEQRRTELEKEQVVLWCKLAFRALQRLNIARKPLLRFELVSAAGSDGATDHIKALSAAARFLAASLAVVDKAEQDQSVAFGGVGTVVTQARESFEDSLLETSGLESDWESTKTDLGKFYKLSQGLADKAKTLAESYAGAMDGDMNRETARKERFRGMLQESVVEYAQILLALNELTETMRADWKLRVDTNRKLPPIHLPWDDAETTDVANDAGPDSSTPRRTRPDIKPKKSEPKGKSFVSKPNLSNEKDVTDLFALDGRWTLHNGGLLISTGAAMTTTCRFSGDFACDLQAVVDRQGPEGYQVQIEACGEMFEVKGKGTYRIRLERKGEKLGFMTGTAPPVVRILKKEAQEQPTTIAIRCAVQKNFAGKTELFIQSVHMRGKAAPDDF